MGRTITDIFYEKYSDNLRLLKSTDKELWESLKKQELTMATKLTDGLNKQLANVLLAVIRRIEDEDKLLEENVVEFDPVISGMTTFFRNKAITERRAKIDTFRHRKSFTA